MIEVNLLKNKAVVGKAATGKDFEEDISASLGSEFKTGEYSLGGQLLKIVLMFGFLGGLMFLEKTRGNAGAELVNRKSSELSELRSISQEKDTTLESFQDVLDKLKLLKSQDLEVTKIKKDRLNLIISLDALQSATTGDMWFTSVEYKEKEVVIEGRTIVKKALDDFIFSLQKEKTFSKVIVIKDSEVSSRAGEKLLEFKVLANLSLESKPDSSAENKSVDGEGA